MKGEEQPDLIKYHGVKGAGKTGSLLKSISDLVREAKEQKSEPPRVIIFRKNSDGSQKQTQEIQD